MPIKIIDKYINKSELADFAKNQFGNLIKVVVDIKKEIIAIGGELHADEEAIMLEQGSEQKNLWGINIYPDAKEDNFIEFDSMINIRPLQDNDTRSVKNPVIRDKIKKIVEKLIIQ